MTLVAREYRDAYPRAGDLAILCEGDLVGYEAAILRKWVDTSIGSSPLVDVWPCGTSSSIYGLCDSIGRSRPILVIEDRDFRDESTAKKDCENNEKDRRKRGVQLLGWRTWRRNEIENYFLEPDVLYPVMIDAFDCTNADVAQALNEIIPPLALYQSIQDVLYCARKPWIDARLGGELIQGVNAWPTWDDHKRTLKVPVHAEIRGRLEETLGGLATGLRKKKEKWDKLGLLTRFDEKYEAWSKVEVDDPTWRLEWSGKEILQLLRISLSAQHGWRDAASGTRSRLRWQHLNKTKRDAQDQTRRTGSADRGRNSAKARPPTLGLRFGNRLRRNPRGVPGNPQHSSRLEDHPSSSRRTIEDTLETRPALQ